MSSSPPKKKIKVTPPIRPKVTVHPIDGQERVRHTSVRQFGNGQHVMQQSTHILPPTKHNNHVNVNPQTPDVPSEPHMTVTPNLNETGEREKHGASEYFEELLKFKDVFISGFASRHAHPELGKHCHNHPGVMANYRCTSCFHIPLVCQTCILATHHTLPFHRIQEWNGNFFQNFSLKQAGLQFGLGHNGALCPNRSTKEIGSNVVIVDITGVHELTLVYCHCAGRPSYLSQLQQAQFWPATIKTPSTMFTFRLLEHYHHYILVSRGSTLDFWQWLCRITNSTFPEKVPDRYNQLLRTSRIYRLIKALEQSGQSFEIDNYLGTNRRQGLISMPCIACPEPHFNMPPNWEQTAHDKSFVHRLFLHQDANFRNQLKIKTRRDPDDVALFEGRCFYPPEKEFQQYLQKVTHTEEKSDCSNHKAVNLQHILKFRHMQVTGILAVVCRHDCFRPGGQNDLQKGERYANADYALAGAISWVPVPKEIALTYDISCQYNKNIVPRFQANFPDIVSSVEHIHHAIPKKHIVGHIEKCQIRWSCNYLPGFGRVYGEGIEAIWAEDNKQSSSLREMNAGHRQDVTDDNHLDWNYRKNQCLAISTYEHFIHGLEEYSEAKLIFEAASTTVSQGLILKWKETSVLPYQDEQGHWHSVYQAQRDKMPTQTQIYQSLFRTETRASIDQSIQYPPDTEFERSVVDLIHCGLQIQIRQYDLRHKIKNMSVTNRHRDRKTRDEEALEMMQETLLKDVREWSSDMSAHFSQFVDILADQASAFSQGLHDIMLGLPSDVCGAQHRRLPGMEEMVQIELLLRQGQANDMLANLREHLRAEICLRTQKKQHVVGQGPTTRANLSLERAAHKKNRSADIYIIARQAMINLGGFEQDSSLRERYRELNKAQDLRMKDPTRIISLGEGRQPESWIWQIGGEPTTTESSEWEIETDRVRWYKARAALERWREELLLRDADFDRIQRGYTRLSQAFKSLANDLTETGPKALNCEMSDYFAQRSIEAHTLHEKALSLLSRHGIDLDERV